MAAEFQDVDEQNPLDEDFLIYYENKDEFSDSQEISSYDRDPPPPPPPKQQPQDDESSFQLDEQEAEPRRVIAGNRLLPGIFQSKPFGGNLLQRANKYPQSEPVANSHARLRSSSKFKPATLIEEASLLSAATTKNVSKKKPKTINDLIQEEEENDKVAEPQQQRPEQPYQVAPPADHRTTHINPVKGLHSSYDRVDVLSLQSSVSATTLLAVALVGVVALGVLLVIWLRKLLSKKKANNKDKVDTSAAAKNILVLRRNSKIIQSSIETTAMEVDDSKVVAPNDISLEEYTTANQTPPYYTPIGGLDSNDTKENQFVFTGSVVAVPVPLTTTQTLSTTIKSATKPPLRPVLLKSTSVTSSSSGSVAVPTSPRARRFSLYERRAEHHPPPIRRLTKLQIDEPSASTASTTSPPPSSSSATSLSSSSTIVSNRYRSQIIGTSKNGGKSNDKENAIPIGGGDLYSPKMKLSEQVLAQQNSPRSPRFTFSPISTASVTMATNTTSSPLLSSAVYRHGNYFKFPEVDSYVDKDKEKLGLEVRSSSVQMRRARLKSISLDSDGARLVEDNLGVPVEALVGGDDDPAPEVEYNRKNKNHLTINITADADGEAAEDGDQKNCGDNDVTVQTPKTPTFTQTKQKAASLDSSDSSVVYYLPQMAPPSSSTMAKSMSASVPTTPKHAAVATTTNRKYLTSKQLASSSSTTKAPSFDQTKSCDRSSFVSKLGSFNETTIDYSVEYDDDNFIIGVVEETPSTVAPPTAVKSSTTRFTSDHLLGSNLQNPKTSTLSLSNNNLKTLPEVMTLSDFSVDSDETGGSANSRTPRNSILQRRGSNHSLILNINGSFGNLSKSLSISNYSLGSNPSNSSYNLNCQAAAGIGGGTMPIIEGGASSTTTAGGQSSAVASSSSRKRNLLQRRGSNTSLTLNIRGSSSMNLSRYSSQSSLNISSSQQQAQPKVHIQPLTQAQQTTRKGLLERRNSNTSLTLSLQNQALSISNVNLRGSACSLNSMNTNPADLDGIASSQQALATTAAQQQRRKFLSSENLNAVSQCSRLNQAHMRNSTKTCFGSVSDLKPYQQAPPALAAPPSRIGEDDEPAAEPMAAASAHVASEAEPRAAKTFRGGLNISRFDFSSTADETLGFKQTDLCSCTGVRNITTRPLSPQTTSEDFKMYLANIQKLQNASNQLSGSHLRQLSRVFERNYGGGGGRDVAATSSFAKFDDATMAQPRDEQQKLMVRSLHQEFWDLPTNYQEKPLVFGSQAKNRYKSILPNEHSRVLLDCEPGSMEEPYINANYIKGPDYTQTSYIATQGPMPNTIYEFWLMTYQNIAKYRTRCQTFDDQKIIQLTNFTENNRQKCSIYFPVDPDECYIVTAKCEPYKCPTGIFNKYLMTNETDPSVTTVTIADTPDVDNIEAVIPKTNYFVIKNVEIRTKDGFKIRKLQCLYCPYRLGGGGDGQRAHTLHPFTCTHYWYPDWPDHRSPNDVTVLLHICLHTLYGGADGDAERRGYAVQQQPWPIIHCSAGIGRTGCLAAILNGMRQLHSNLMPMRNLHRVEVDGDGDGDRRDTIPSQSVLKSNLFMFKDNNDRDNRNYVQCLMTVDILGIVCNLRLQRGGMVQNSEQYELIHRAMCLYLNRLEESKNK